MPAVTVPDITVLRRIPIPMPDASSRPVRSVTSAPRGFEGEGFPVRRAFAGVALADLDPFVHMDQMGEVEYAPGEPKGTPWHPHRGFETVTYMIDGIMAHRDSSDGDSLTVSAMIGQHGAEPTLEVLILGGRPIRERVAWLGPFVMNTRSEVLAAFEDYQAGRLGSVPAVHGTC